MSICRATCQELCSFIDGHENRIADTIAKCELRRLQAHSDKLKAFGPPASIIDFVEGLRFFTSQNHVPLVARWILHLFRNVVSNAENPTGDKAKWAVLARTFLQLQRAHADDARRGKPKRDCRQNFIQMKHDWDDVSCQQIMEVYDLVESASATQPHFPGTVYAPQVVERDTWPELRLTTAYDGSKCFHPVVPYELVHLLDLPKLPQNKGFFYYVEEEWVCREIEQGPLCPMVKAAVLQLVKVF